MDTRYRRPVRRVVTAILLAAGLTGCVYTPPYAPYDPYYPTYGYPTYVGPPVTLDLGFAYYHHHHGYHGHRGYYGGRGRHGWGYGGRRH